MLSNLHKKTWMDGLHLQNYQDMAKANEKTVKVRLIDYHQSIVQWNL